MSKSENNHEIAINIVENEGIFHHNKMDNSNKIRKITRNICRYIFYIICVYIFINFFLHLIKVLFTNKIVVLSDSFEYGDLPKIQITRDNFYGGFSLEDPKTYQNFIDETIYYPKAYFNTVTRHEISWSMIVKEIELERCSISKIGEFYRNIYKDITLNNLYCFKEINENFIGHYTYGYYSYIFIQFFPCKNTTENNNHCKPIEIIDSFLKGTFLSMELQDIELNPPNYNYPVRPRNQDIFFPIRKKLFKEIHIYYQLTKIRTYLDKLGIDFLEKVKDEIYLKYHSTKEMTYLSEDDIYQTGESFCNLTIKLHEDVRIQRREYKYKLFY